MTIRDIMEKYTGPVDSISIANRNENGYKVENIPTSKIPNNVYDLKIKSFSVYYTTLNFFI